jgi:16S rRNA (adenine1518-N6/adenine1519-N6)-dimethyltransferase
LKKKKTSKTDSPVAPKKHLGQHFLIDETISARIAQSLLHPTNYTTLLEIGAGTGALSKYLIQNARWNLFLCEIDPQSVAYLKKTYPSIQEKQIIDRDFLQLPLNEFDQKLGIIGNFPYHISTQIMFKILEHKDEVLEVVGMFQKEVAQRMAAKPKNKTYGILSVLLQAFYDIEYLFTVDASAFNPPPKVQSGVIRLTRNFNKNLESEEKKFKPVVKMAFNQRRKTLKNALSALLSADFDCSDPLWSLRAEALSVSDFDRLTQLLYPNI